MTLVKNDIELSKTEEAEEINAPEAKMVEACDFHSQGTGSLPVWSTTSDWEVEKCGNSDFNIKKIDRQVAEITTARLSVLKT